MGRRPAGSRLRSGRDPGTRFGHLRAEGAHVPPARRDVFRALHLTPLEKVRVVILGQDPCPSPDVADGLALSVPAPLSAPRSLRTIYRNLEGDPSLGSAKPLMGDLTPWATNGVLLLNTALTVSQGIPGSHARRWATFTDAVLQAVAEEREHVAFLLWGSHAIRKAASVPIQEPPHKMIRSAHPAARGRTKSAVSTRAPRSPRPTNSSRTTIRSPCPWPL